MHVHSTYSDGTASVGELVTAAGEAGADVLVLTDHDTLQARHDGWEGWHGGVLVVVGEEISPRGGHLLALGTSEEIPHAGRSELELCRQVDAVGGLAIAAHPFSEGSRMSRTIGRPHPWPALDDPCCHGVELWSLTTDLAESWRSPREAVSALRRPERALSGPPPWHLRRWDELCRARRVVAIGGLDAHQPGIRIRGRVRSIMPHGRWFRFLRTHLLLDAPLSGRDVDDVAVVLAAVREGACYLARIDIGDPSGFAFSAEADDGRFLPMGTAAAATRVRMTVSLSGAADIRLLRDGEVVEERHGDRLEVRLDAAGVYRIEAWRHAHGHHQPWIVSNPVYLRGATRPAGAGCGGARPRSPCR